MISRDQWSPLPIKRYEVRLLYLYLDKNIIEVEMKLNQYKLVHWISSNPEGHPGNPQILKGSEGCHSAVAFRTCRVWKRLWNVGGSQDAVGPPESWKLYGTLTMIPEMDHGCLNVSTAKAFPKVSERWCKSRPVNLTGVSQGWSCGKSPFVLGSSTQY